MQQRQDAVQQPQQQQYALQQQQRQYVVQQPLLQQHVVQQLQRQRYVAQQPQQQRYVVQQAQQQQCVVQQAQQQQYVVQQAQKDGGTVELPTTVESVATDLPSDNVTWIAAFGNACEATIADYGDPGIDAASVAVTLTAAGSVIVVDATAEDGDMVDFSTSAGPVAADLSSDNATWMAATDCACEATFGAYGGSGMDAASIAITAAQQPQQQRYIVQQPQQQPHEYAAPQQQFMQYEASRQYMVPQSQQQQYVVRQPQPQQHVVQLTQQQQQQQPQQQRYLWQQPQQQQHAAQQQLFASVQACVGLVRVQQLQQQQYVEQQAQKDGDTVELPTTVESVATDLPSGNATWIAAFGNACKAAIADCGDSGMDATSVAITLTAFALRRFPSCAVPGSLPRMMETWSTSPTCDAAPCHRTGWDQLQSRHQRVRKCRQHRQALPLLRTTRRHAIVPDVFASAGPGWRRRQRPSAQLRTARGWRRGSRGLRLSSDGGQPRRSQWAFSGCERGPRHLRCGGAAIGARDQHPQRLPTYGGQPRRSQWTLSGCERARSTHGAAFGARDRYLQPQPSYGAAIGACDLQQVRKGPQHPRCGGCGHRRVRSAPAAPADLRRSAAAQSGGLQRVRMGPQHPRCGHRRAR